MCGSGLWIRDKPPHMRGDVEADRLGPVTAPAPTVDVDAAFRAHAAALLATARAITLNEAEAQDLVQTTFEIALRRAAQLREPEAMRAWLMRIETREAFRLVRRLRRWVRLDTGVVEVAVAPPDAAESIAVRTALGTLPRRIRAAVVLHHLVGLSVAETAEAMRTSENTVKAQLKVGLVRLREALGDG